MKRSLSEFDYMLASYESNAEYLEELRQEFTKKFSIDFIKNHMQIDDYVEGHGSKDSFCYWLEYGLVELGSIKGGSVHKFGIYYSKKLNQYARIDRWSQGTLTEEFNNLKQALIELIKAGRNQDLGAIENAPFGPDYRAKILSVYYPDRYLNIFSETVLSYFLFQFDGVANHDSLSRYEMQQKLIALKQEDKVAKNWNNIIFGNYLYHLFPEAAKLSSADRTNVDDSKYFKIKEPKIPIATDKEEHHVVPIFHDVVLKKARKRKSKSSNKQVSKIDYVKQEKQKQRIGDEGEKLVVQAERDKLKNYPRLQSKVNQVSLTSDSLGYDVLSFEPDGTPRYIEVKSSNDKPKSSFDFILTENELEQAKNLKNYWIYRVFKVKSEHPEVYKIKNPFESDAIQLEPIKYKANVKIQKLE